MPSNYDADIQLSVDLDATDVENESDRLQKELKNIFNSTSFDKFSQKSSDALRKLQTNMASTAGKLDEVWRKADALLADSRSFQTADENKELAKYQELQATLSKLTEELAKFKAAGQDTAMSKTLAKDIYDYEQEIDKIIRQRKELSEARKATTAGSAEYKQISAEMKTLWDRLVQLQDKKEAIERDPGPAIARRIEANNNALKITEQRIQEVRNEMQALEGSGKLDVFTDKAQASYDGLIRRANDLNNKLNIQQDAFQKTFASANAASFGQAFKDIQPAGTVVQDTTTKLSTMARVLETVKNGFRNFAQTAISGLSEVKSKSSDLPNTIGSKLKSLKKHFSNVTKAIKNFAKSIHTKYQNAIKSFTKSADDSGKSMKNLFRNIMRYGLGVRSLYFLFRRIRSALKEAFSELGEYSPEFGSILSRFTNSLTALRNSFATAFAPIASVVLPLLSNLIARLIDAMNVLAQFNATLTGKDTFTKISVSAKDASKSIGGAAKKAKELKLQLMGFDDVNILSEDHDAGGGGGSGSGTDLSGFSTENVDLGISEFAQRVKDAFLAQDWEGVGALFAEKINGIFTKANEALKADSLYAKLNTVTDAIAGILNGLVYNIDWNLIGDTLGSGINLIIFTINGLLTKIDWKAIGTALANGLNGLVTSVNWTGLGEIFANRLNALLNIVNGFVTTFNWEEAGKSLSDSLNGFINGIDWTTLAQSFGEGLNGIFTFLNTAILNFDWVGAATSLVTALNEWLATVDWALVGQTISNFVMGALQFIRTAIQETDWVQVAYDIRDLMTGIDWLGILAELGGLLLDVGSALITMFLTGMSDVFTDIGTWIRENIFDPIVDWLTLLFTDPQEVIDAGNATVEAIKDGIVDGLLTIGTWIKEHFFDPIMDGILSAFGIQGGVATQVSKNGNAIVGGIKSGILKGITGGGGIGSWLAKKVFNPTQTGIVAAFGIRGNTAGKIVPDGESVTKGLQQGIETPGIWSNIRTALTTKGLANVIAPIDEYDTNTAGSGAIQDLSTGLSALDNWNTINTNMKGSMDTIVNTIKNTDWSGTGSDSVSTFSSGVSSQQSNVLSAVTTTIVTTMVDTLDAIDLTTSGGDAVTTFAQGMDGKKWDVWSVAFYGVAGTLGDVIGGINLYDSGTNAVQGFINGLEGMRTGLLEKARNLADGVTRAIQNALGIHSPSKVWEEQVGKMLMLGLSEGITDNMANVMGAVGDVSKTLSNTKLAVPDVVMGKVIPDSVATVKADVQLNEIADLLKMNQTNTVTNEQLMAVANDIIQALDRVNFYIGDEQIERHAQLGREKLSRRLSVVAEG